MTIKADLHIHSTLSPCGSLEMSPAAIVGRALELGLDLIAVTDHNSVENGFYAAALGRKKGLRVLFGMEAQTREDVHILCLFEEQAQVERFYGEVYPHLPEVGNNPDFFGDQAVVDEQENVIRFEGKLLMNALDLPIAELAERVRRRGGYLIPSHVESNQFGLLPVLGAVPPELAGCVLEISYRSRAEEARGLFPTLSRFPLISNSDAHFLRDMGRVYTAYETESPALADLYRAALNGRFTIVRRPAGG